MKVLFDTNVVLDALLDREPWAGSALSVFYRVEAGALIGHLGVTTLTTIHYIARRNVETKAANKMMRTLIQLFKVATVKRAVLEGALALDFDNFKDAVLDEAGQHSSARNRDTRCFWFLKSYTAHIRP